jgi:hypothetical protein
MPLTNLTNRHRRNPIRYGIVSSFLAQLISAESERLAATQSEHEALIIKHKIIDAKILLHQLTSSVVEPSTLHSPFQE